MIEIEELKGLDNPATVYEEIRKILKEIETEPIRIGTWRIDELIPRSRDMLKKELNVKMVELRAEIREQLDKDERQQLKLPSPAESKTEEPAAGIPKNDYRRHQNGTEEDDGK